LEDNTENHKRIEFKRCLLLHLIQEEKKQASKRLLSEWIYAPVDINRFRTRKGILLINRPFRLEARKNRRGGKE
jgi:hypothetical protein